MATASHPSKQAKIEIQFVTGTCSLGPILVAANEQGICAVFLGDNVDALLSELKAQFPGATSAQEHSLLTQWLAQIIKIVNNPSISISLPLDIRGTDFQRRVWQALQTIPAGQTATYTDIAHKIGSPRSVRAVARACATNQHAILIPCHRVIRSDGKLSGYRWGIAIKQTLLEREKTIPIK